MTDFLALLKEARTFCWERTVGKDLGDRLDAAILELEEDPHRLKVLLPNLPAELVTLSGPLRLAAIGYGRECIRLLRQNGLSQPERKCGTCKHQHKHDHGSHWCGNAEGPIHCAPAADDWFCADWQARGGKDDR